MKKTKKIVVNALTISRIIGAFLMPLILNKNSMFTLIIFLSLLFLTDFLDGKLSRLWNVQTMGGRVLDTVGDKLLAISCIFIMLKKHSYLLALLLLELAISILNIFRLSRREVVDSSLLGKLKTWFLSITMIAGAINFINPGLLNIVFDSFKINCSIIIKDEMVFFLTVVTVFCELMTILSYLKETFENKEKSNLIKVSENKKRSSFKGRRLMNIKDMCKILFDETRYDTDKEISFFDLITIQERN